MIANTKMEFHMVAKMGSETDVAKERIENTYGQEQQGE